jgi:hypothetical protein
VVVVHVPQQSDPPLTNAELREDPVEVEGDFYPAVQAVAAEALPLPAGAATQGTLEEVRDYLGEQQTDALTDDELRALPVPVSGTFYPVTQPVSATDLDVRDLTSDSDSVRSVDAAELSNLTAVPFTITAAGSMTLVAAPGGSSRLRLRRISPTYAIRSPESEPILALFVGDVEVQRGNVLTGRFDVTAASSDDAITLTADVLDADGKITGTVYYSMEA